MVQIRWVFFGFTKNGAEIEVFVAEKARKNPDDELGDKYKGQKDDHETKIKSCMKTFESLVLSGKKILKEFILRINSISKELFFFNKDSCV